MVDCVLEEFEGKCLMLFVLVVKDCKGEYVKFLENLIVNGYIWVCIDGEICDLFDLLKLEL